MALQHRFVIEKNARPHQFKILETMILRLGRPTVAMPYLVPISAARKREKIVTELLLGLLHQFHQPPAPRRLFRRTPAKCALTVTLDR
jgi:hypothetical protein